MSKADESSRRQLPMTPGWGEPQPLDPNWHDGSYHGLRMRLDPYRAAYGFHRLHRAHDLGGHGGYDGRYDAGVGEFDRQGLYLDPFDRTEALRAAPGQLPPADEGDAPRHVEDGGVRGDNRYLRQYNASTPEAARPDDRGYGHAPEGGADGTLARDVSEREANGGRGGGGTAPGGEPGPDPRR
jgi:hypothetical protein